MIDQSLGWIKLHRELLDNPMTRKSDYLALWVILLLKANHKESSIIIDGKKMPIMPGQFITSRRNLSLLSGISESKIQRALKCYENEHQIEQQTFSKFRLISIVNWSKYQDNEHQIEQQVNNKRTTSEQQVNTNNNVKNDKNIKNNNVQLSNLLKKLILQNNPKAKITDSQIKNWGNTIRLMIERDKRTVEEIESLIKFSQNDDFWKSNILSMDKLRKQFDRLTLQAKQKEPKNEPEVIQKPEPMLQLTPEQIADNKKRLGKLIDSLN